MAEGVGVNRESPVSKSNKPPCDTAVTGQPDNATQRAKQIGLTQGAYCSLCPWQSQNKWPQAYRYNWFSLFAYSNLHYHHLSWGVAPNILVSIWFGCYAGTYENKGKLHSLTSQFMDHHTAFVAVNASKQQLWKIVWLREFSISSSCSLLLCICAPMVFWV